MLELIAWQALGRELYNNLSLILKKWESIHIFHNLKKKKLKNQKYEVFFPFVLSPTASKGQITSIHTSDLKFPASKQA